MSKRPSLKLAVITGGSSGIGKSIAERLDRQGIQVIVADISASNTEKEGIVYRKCDVTKGQDVDELYAYVTSNFGHPDCLILNAGQGIREKLSEGDPEKWQKVIQTNLMGPLRLIRAFTPAMTSNENGHIVFISSVSANQPHPYGGVYAASKTGLEVIAETLRLETLPSLKISIVRPGIVDTDFFANEISGHTSVEELGMGAIDPEEIADDVWYILNKKSGTSINKIEIRPSAQNF